MMILTIIMVVIIFIIHHYHVRILLIFTVDEVKEKNVGGRIKTTD